MLWKRPRRGWDIDVHRPSLGPRWGRAEPADDGRDGGRGGPPLGTTASCAPGAHVPNMYQRYKLAFSELKREYDVTKYRDFPRVHAFEVKGWMSLSCTFVAPYYLTFSGPCPPHFGGAPAIPPLSRQSGQDPLPSPSPNPPSGRTDVTAVQLCHPREIGSRLHSFWPCGFARARLPCMCHFVEQEIKDKRSGLSLACAGARSLAPLLFLFYSRVLEIRHRAS